MVSSAAGRWRVRGVTFVLGFAAAASAVFWGLRLGGPESGPPGAATAATAPSAAADPAAVARFLGGGPAAVAAPAPALASRLVLVGVVAGARSGEGAAVIAVDGKPARPFRVGAAVDEGLVLQSVQGRRALVGPAQGAPALTLELPAPRK